VADWIAKLWCSWFHGGGEIKRDRYDRINWQCCTCGRWSDPIDSQTERLLIDSDIEAKLKEKNGG
jgi:hypothetical protein